MPIQGQVIQEKVLGIKILGKKNIQKLWFSYKYIGRLIYKSLFSSIDWDEILISSKKVPPPSVKGVHLWGLCVNVLALWIETHEFGLYFLFVYGS
jgi:hypothetical protein